MRLRPGPSSRYGRSMPGAIIIVLVLLAFPIVVGLSTAAIAAGIGYFLNRDADIRHAGSELVDLNN